MKEELCEIAGDMNNDWDIRLIESGTIRVINTGMEKKISILTASSSILEEYEATKSIIRADPDFADYEVSV